jgi:DNA-binding GntR family transcriptional regulator
MAEPRITQSERAYRYLMDELVQERWQTGDTVSTYALTEELAMSRTPILAALKRLESEGLVAIIPQVGCRVVRPGSSALDELFALRGALDGVGAATAAKLVDADGLSELEAMLHELEVLAGRGEARAFGELDERLHLRIVDAARMPRLAHMARSVWSSLRQQLARLPLTDAELLESTPEHREIYDAVHGRAPEQARAAAERHAGRCATRYGGHLQHARGRVATNGSFAHDALFYASDEEFIDAALPFVLGGLNADERAMAVTTRHNIGLLEGALGARSEQAEFHDSSEWYRVPSETLLAYQRYVASAGRTRVRIIGEPLWAGLSPAAIKAWALYEASLNVAFAIAPVKFLCPYDVRALPGPILQDARHSHPQIRNGTRSSPNPEFTDLLAPLASNSPVPGPTNS